MQFIIPITMQKMGPRDDDAGNVETSLETMTITTMTIIIKTITTVVVVIIMMTTMTTPMFLFCALLSGHPLLET